MDDACCPMCKTTKYRNPSMRLMVNVCGHALCESCVELLFAKGSGACQECRIPLRRADFRLQLFEDASVDKAVDIRRNILRSFNKVREDFEDLRGYNDYLEMVEDIIFNLCNGIDVAETERKVREYKEANQEAISKNRHKISDELLELEDIMAEEKKIAEKARAEMVAAEKAEKLQLAKNKEKLIDDLMFSEGDADAIVADHQTKIAQDEADAAAEKSAVAKFTSGADLAASRGDHQRHLPAATQAANVQGERYVWQPLEQLVEGPSPPHPDDLARYGAHVRQAEPRERAAGYTEDMAALRAVQDAMCGLYFSAAAAAVNG